MSFMSCLETCVGHMMELSLTDEVCISHMFSLPAAVIQTVKMTFKHCKVHYYYYHIHTNNKSLVSNNKFIIGSLHAYGTCICYIIIM